MTASVDLERVDWLAVEFVCNGTPMWLGNDSATLKAAILSIGYMVTCPQIAERCGTNTRRISRVLYDAGATRCPWCKRYVMCDDVVLPPHVQNSSGYAQKCRMSGYRADDDERIAEIRSDSRQLGLLT